MIELADLISELRSELTTAMAAGAGEALQFSLGPVEIEVSVALQREAGAGGKVRFWVAEVGADAKHTRSDTQLIRLKLEPQLVRDGVFVRPVLISGADLDGED